MHRRRRDVLTHLVIVLIAGFVGFSAVARAAGPAARPTASDEQTYREFEQIVADLPTPDKIQAWEAYLLKYPNSAYVPKVKDTLAVLKGEKRAAPAATPVPAPTRVTSDHDLDFLNDSVNASSTPAPTPVFVDAPTPAPTPMAVATPRPTPSPRRVASNGGSNDSFMDAPPEHRRGTNRVAFNDPPSNDRPPMYTGPRNGRPPRGIESHASHTEVAVFGGIAPDETYVRNTLFGVAATQRFGRLWALEIEGAGAQNSETSLLRSLRALNAEPEVISKFNFLAGGAVEANLLSAEDAGRGGGRNDLYVIAGGGVVNTDLEICKQEGTTKCSTPLFINGVNFGYATGGVGHRFYLTHWMTIRSEIRGRVVFELIDGVMSPRANIQIGVGPSITF